ncbi:MAG: DUF805 domain-containing protein [Novosphingobium sp.]
MLDAVKYGLRNLFNLRGRDARQTFWYFVLLIFLLNFAFGLLITVPLVINMFSNIVDAAQAGASPEAVEARMMGSMTGMLEQMTWPSVIISVVTGLMLLPGLVRRLHDSDMSGWWAALPGALYAAAISQTPAQMRRTVEMMAAMDPANPPNSYDMMREQGLVGLASYAAIGLVIYFGVRKSTPGPNRYGEASASF